MPPRRAAAIKAQRITSDIESEDDEGSESDQGVDSEVDAEGSGSDEEDPDADDVDMLESEEEDDLGPSGAQTGASSMSVSQANTPLTDLPRPSASASAPAKPTLKVRLKLTGPKDHLASTGATSSAATSATPEPDIVPSKNSRTAKRAIVYDDPSDEEAGENIPAQPAQSGSGSRMTARQAALSTGFEAEHVELPMARKKKILTAAEIAARRADSAKKRKHMTAQKLEDDKTETINRLLKKQSAGTRRKKALEEQEAQADGTPSSVPGVSGSGGTHAGPSRNQNHSSIPMFRWISTSRSPVVVLPDNPDDAAKGKAVANPNPTPTPRVTFSFSIPHEFLPPVPKPPASASVEPETEQDADADPPVEEEAKMEAGTGSSVVGTPMEGVVAT